MNEKRKRNFTLGIRHGIPICLGYFAVSFALGIAAKQIGLNALQAGLMSIGMVASAGEFAALSLIGGGAGVIEMVATCIVVNMRYFLMSCSLSQKIRPETPFFHRFIMAHTVTDELFGLSSAFPDPLDPLYTYGAAIVSWFGWTAGTVLGVLVGSILPDFLVAALGASLYGMFLAIIIPPAKKERFIGGLVLVSMALSGLFAILPYLKNISSGFRIIILTILLSAAAAALRPVRLDDSEADENGPGGSVTAPEKEETHA